MELSRGITPAAGHPATDALMETTMAAKKTDASTNNAEQKTREKQVNQSISEDKQRQKESTAVKPSGESKPSK